ncbi:MAG: carboxymuconolactone decarboxylase family protein [Rhizobiales bacterium]|nr:carboxymuconolactone decarboxylase family protein [Hyphomicrobiales bacterium]
MPRIPMVPEHPEDPQLAEMFAEVRQRWPQVPNLYRVLGNSPEMLRAWLDMAWPLRLNASTSRRTRELMILHGARLTKTAFEWAHHVPLALEAGVQQSEIDRLYEGIIPDTVSEAERAALQLAEEVTLGPEASAECIEALRPHYSEAEIVELVLTASFYVCVGRTLKSLDVPLEDRFPAPW